MIKNIDVRKCQSAVIEISVMFLRKEVADFFHQGVTGQQSLCRKAYFVTFFPLNYQSAENVKILFPRLL